MQYKTGAPRDQLFLFNECIDQMIEINNPVRVIDAYVESLVLRKLGFKVHELKTGAPPYKNETMLKLYIYGYMERVRSSRKLEKECNRNKEMIWLIEGLAPDFKTIADFRKDNREGIKNIFKEFLHFCNKMNLLSLETVAIDGTKLRAQNSINNIYKRDEIDQVKERIVEKIAEYLAVLDIEDEKEVDNLKLSDGEEVEAILEKLKMLSKRKDKVDKIKKKFEEDEELKVFFATDPDSRFQSDRGKINAGYNAQIAGDDKYKLIIADDVTNKSNDTGEMSSMVGKVNEVKQELAIKTETKAVMDAGYYNEMEIVRNKDIDSIKIITPDKKEVEKSRKKKIKKSDGDRVPAEGFEITDFSYDRQNNVYICPNGKILSRTNRRIFTEKSGRKVFEYQCKECDGCEKRYLCAKSKKGRAIRISVNKEFMDRFKADMKSEENKKLISKRKEIIEHPFGTLKRNLGYTYFMQIGLDKVKTEFSFMCFTYNFKRVLNIFTVDQLLEALK